MSEIISRGTIIVDLKAGTIDLPKPDYDIYERGQKNAAVATEHHNKALDAQAKAIEQLNAIGRQALADSRGGDKWKAGLGNMANARGDAAAAAKATNDAATRAAESEAAELERVNQLILSDRARRHARTVEMTEAEQRAQQQAAQQAIQDHRAVNESIQRVGEGVMKLTRSAVLLGFAQDESMQSLLKNLAMVQAGYDAFDGSRKIIQGLNAVMDQASRSGMSLAQVIGRGNIALAALAAAATAAAVAYQMLNAEEEKRKKKFSDSASGVMGLRQTIRSMQSPEDRKAIAERDLGGAIRFASKHADYADEAGKKAENLLSIEREITQQSLDRLNKSRDAIRAQQSQLEIAQQRRDAERDIVRSVEASYSKLSAGEQRRLQSAAEKVKAGGDINEYERKLFERAGQGGIADSSRSKEGRAEGADQFIKTVQGLDGAATGTVGSFEDLNQTVMDLEKSLKSLAGDDANATLAKLEQQTEDVIRLFEKFQNKLFERLTKLDVKVTETATEQGRIAGELSRR
jgi:hypothetical protein